MRRFVVVLGLSGFLSACGGGGSSQPPPATPPAAPSALSYVTAPAFTINTAITAMTPTVTGSPTGYSVSPALPAGLSLDATTGAISGTPTAIQPASNYTVTASNSSGATSAVVSLRVNDVPPSLQYPRADYQLVSEVAIASVSPALGGGAVTHWAIDRPLPAGLVFDVASGVISGAPMEVVDASTHVVTASNSGGFATFQISFAVESRAFLDLGHGGWITTMRHVGPRFVTADSHYRATLWDDDTGTALASLSNCYPGPQPCVDLKGGRAVFFVDTGFRIYSADTGTVQAEILTATANTGWWALSADGNYLCRAITAELSCWNTNGTLLFTRIGDHRGARVTMHADQLRLGNPFVGPAVVQVVTLPSGATTDVPFAGAFESWFSDGEAFITTEGTTIRVYDKAGALLDTLQGPGQAMANDSLAGWGSWLWYVESATPGYSLKLFRVGSSASPAATFPSGYPILASGGFIALNDPASNGGPQLGLVSLTGPSPARTDVPILFDGVTAFAARGSGDWIYGNREGLVARAFQAAPHRRLTLGAARSIAGSDNRFAIATAAGIILQFNAQSRALEGQLPFQAAKVELSDDGTRLAAGPDVDSAPLSPGHDHSIRVFDSATRTVVAEWPYPPPAGGARYFSLAGGGDVIALFTAESGNYTERVLQVDGTLIWSRQTPDLGQSGTDTPVMVSPDGRHFAATSLPGDIEIFRDGILQATATGDRLVGWIDNARFLVNNYSLVTTPSGNPVQRYDGATLHGTDGAMLSTSAALPELRRFQRLDNDRVYSPDLNRLLDLHTGDTEWQSGVSIPSPGAGAVIGDAVVFATRSGTVRIEAR